MVVADESPPVFGEFPPTGYISQSSYDNKVLSMVTEDREGTKPFKLIVTDADDDEVKTQVIILPVSKNSGSVSRSTRFA